jgi:hypothetical protein
MARRSLVAAIVVALTLALGASAFARADANKLKGTVGPSFTISLTKNGHRVRTLTAGTYTFVISDKASIHNFTLEQEKGGKFEKDLTSVAFVGTKTVKVKLKAGKWKFYCKIHESQMFGFFTVK